MNFTIHFGWWSVPAFITIGSLLWAIFWPSEDHSSSWIPDLTPLFRLIPALFVSLLAWAIAGAVK